VVSQRRRAVAVEMEVIGGFSRNRYQWKVVPSPRETPEWLMSRSW
jgi:hypothetical protein